MDNQTDPEDNTKLADGLNIQTDPLDEALRQYIYKVYKMVRLDGMPEEILASSITGEAKAAINAEIAKAKAGSVTPQTPNPQPFDNASGGVIPEGVALLPITPGQKLHILEGFRNRIEKILLHNVTKIEQEYPLQDGSYSIGYVSADLLWAELGRIKQKIRNVQEYQAEKSIERHQRTDGGQDE